MKVGEVWIRKEDKLEATIDTITFIANESDDWIGCHYCNNYPNTCFYTRKGFIETHIYKRN